MKEMPLIGALRPLPGSKEVKYYDIASVGGQREMPKSLKVLLEGVIRLVDKGLEPVETLHRILSRPTDSTIEVPFLPGRILLQDFTGVPLVVDMAAMREAVAVLGGDPSKVNPVLPVDLVVDHSVQVDKFGVGDALAYNMKLEYARNRERYALLRWAQKAFSNFRVVPPGKGICHQVNLEYLASVVRVENQEDGTVVAFPDTLLGTDSHTTMVNALGVLGWGVGGIEAEAAMLGIPLRILWPEVIGVRLYGSLGPYVTCTDLVLTVTELLRRLGVVGKFVEFFGPGLKSLTVPDRATIANMCPEYGATAAFFPVDGETLRYLRFTGRPEKLVQLVEAYARAQGLFYEDGEEIAFSKVVELDLASVEPCCAGPKRPQDRVPLGKVPESFREAKGTVEHVAEVEIEGERYILRDGAVAIAAITSCTNTSNAAVMVAAGLLAKKAYERGLGRRPWVKTSLAPGSRVVTQYLERAGLLPYLEALGFFVVGYGCTTCIGNSGPLPEPVARAVEGHGLVVASVLSGNRNFEGRIHPLVKASFLASPPLVVAYALAGRVDIDLTREPIGVGADGSPVYLKDIWPRPEEILEAIERGSSREDFERIYGKIFEGEGEWEGLDVPQGELFRWDERSLYVRRPPFFEGMTAEPGPLPALKGLRVLVMLGDSVTTDHISPAGAIKVDSPAGRYLMERGVEVRDFNTYGSRRGNHEVMMRGTFANVRLRNLLVPGVEGGFTLFPGESKPIPIYDAAMRYREKGIPLMVIAGREYGTGSSRDWAAKGTALLGVRVVLAQSFERIHRSNLVGMGVLPIEFEGGESAQSLGLSGTETYEIEGFRLEPKVRVTVRAVAEDGSEKRFLGIVRLDTRDEVETYRHGGILLQVARRLLGGAGGP